MATNGIRRPFQLDEHTGAIDSAYVFVIDSSSFQKAKSVAVSVLQDKLGWVTIPAGGLDGANFIPVYAGGDSVPMQFNESSVYFPDRVAIDGKLTAVGDQAFDGSFAVHGALPASQSPAPAADPGGAANTGNGPTNAIIEWLRVAVTSALDCHKAHGLMAE